jgi:hypothetical protein
MAMGVVFTPITFGGFRFTLHLLVDKLIFPKKRNKIEIVRRPAW